MSQENTEIKREGVAGLKKYKMSPLNIAFIVYCLVAAGAFGIEEMIPLSGPGLTIVMLAVFPIVWVIPICLTISELSAYMPAECGMYVWVKEAFGEMWGFIVGWWGALSVYVSIAAYVVLVVGYTEKFLPLTPAQEMILKVGMVLLFTVINLLGIEGVSKVSTVLSIIILAAFGLVTVVGFANWNYNPMTPFTPEGQSIIDSIGGSICIAIWMYCGYGCISNMAGEIENPEVIPKGLKIVVPIIALSYILPTLAGLASVGSWESWGVDGEGVVGYSDVLLQNLGKTWGIVFLIMAIISQCAIFNAYIAAGSRSFFVLADDKLCPKFLTKLSQKRGVPYVPIILLAAVTLLLMNFDFTTLTVIITPLGILAYGLLAITFYKLRKKIPIEERGNVYYVKGGKTAVALLTVLPIIVGIVGLLVNGTEFFLLGFVSILSAPIVYIICKLAFGGLYKIDPEKHPINNKTKLAKGDVIRLGAYLIIFGLYAFLGTFFLKWYEGDWAEAYYKEVYGSGLASNFDLMIDIARYGGAIAIILGFLLYFLGKKIDRSNCNNDEAAVN